jgi:hypothetical protein
MYTLVDARHQIESVKRPSGYSNYAWEAAKRIAWEAWDCYLNGKTFRTRINYFHPDFYRMLQTPDGYPIVPQRFIRNY